MVLKRVEEYRRLFAGKLTSKPNTEKVMWVDSLDFGLKGAASMVEASKTPGLSSLQRKRFLRRVVQIKKNILASLNMLEENALQLHFNEPQLELIRELKTAVKKAKTQNDFIKLVTHTCYLGFDH